MSFLDMTVTDALIAGYIQFTDLGRWALDRRRYECELELGLLHGPLPEVAPKSTNSDNLGDNRRV